MRTSTALLLTIILAGCITFEDAEDGDETNTPTPTPTATPQGTIDVTWASLTPDPGDPSGTSLIATACPAEAPTAIVSVRASGSSDVLENSFACTAGGADVTVVPGTYDVWVAFAGSGGTIHVQSQTEEVVVANGGSAPAYFAMLIGYAYYRISWDLKQGASSITCSQVAGENGVAITATEGGGGLYDTTVDCEEGITPATTLTRPLPIGADYTLVLSILDSMDAPIGTSATLTPAELPALDVGGEIGEVGVVDIVIP